jgi:hypothetical protein
LSTAVERLTIACCAALYAPLLIPLLTGRTFVLDDLAWFHLPVRHLYQQALVHGDTFLWTPALSSGFFLHGEGQAGMYHPLHLLLYRWLPLGVALNLEMLSSYAIGLAGMWLLLRRLSLSRAAAVFGAMVFAFSGFHLMHLMHLNAVAVSMEIPWMLLAADLLLAGRSARERAAGFAGVAIVLGSQLLLGFPQFLWMTALATAGLAALRALEGARLSRVALLAAAALFGVAIGAVQLLPTLDLLRDSTRSGMAQGLSMTFSLHPINLIQLWSPYALSQRVFAISGEFFIHEFTVYNGAFCTVALAWLGMRWRYLERRRLAAGALVLGGIALLLSLGRYGGLYALLALVPGLGSFRAPARHIVLVHLALSVLAAIALEDLIGARAFIKVLPAKEVLPPKGGSHGGLWRLGVPVALSVATTIAGAALVRSGWAAANGVDISSAGRAGIGVALMTLTAVFFARAAHGAPWAVMALVLLTAMDLGWWGLRYVLRIPPGDPHALVPPVGFPPESRPGTTIYAPVPPADDNQFVLSGYRLSTSYTGLPPLLVLDPKDRLAHRLSGVRWAWDPTGWQRVSDTMPRARLVAQVVAAGFVPDEIRTIDIAQTAIVEGPSPELLGPAGTAEVTVDRPGRIVVDTVAAGPQLLVLTERFHRGWRGRQDGQPLVLGRVYGDFLGVVVSAGRHRVELVFDPPSVRWGMMLSIGGVLLTGLVAMMLSRS